MRRKLEWFWRKLIVFFYFYWFGGPKLWGARCTSLATPLLVCVIMLKGFLLMTQSDFSPLNLDCRFLYIYNGGKLMFAVTYSFWMYEFALLFSPLVFSKGFWPGDWHTKKSKGYQLPLSINSTFKRKKPCT